MAADWRDPGQWHRGYLWIHKPDVVFAAPLDYTNTNTYGKYLSTNIWYLLYFDTPTVGDVNASTVKEGMTLLLGSTAGDDDYGRCRVKGVITEGYTGGSEKVIQVFVSDNIHDGELHIVSTCYITVLDDRRAWFKKPYYGAYNQNYYDGDIGHGGTTDHQFPIANMGPPYAGFVDSGTGVATVDFTAADSFVVGHEQALGGWTERSYSGHYADEENGANVIENAFDSNAGTYWESTSSDAYAYVSCTGAPVSSFLRYTITAEATTTAPQDWVVGFRIAGTSYTVDEREGETGWSAGETRTYYVDRWHSYQPTSPQIIITITDNNGGGTIQVREFTFEFEDRTTSSPYSWDVDDGTITVGSSTTEDITATFPPGQRYVSQTVTDTDTYEGETERMVATFVRPGTLGDEHDYSSATCTASSTYAGFDPADMIDDDTGTSWLSAAGGAPWWVKVSFSASVYCSGYRYTGTTTLAPRDWVFQGSANDVDWTTLDTQTDQEFGSNETKSYPLPNSVEYRYYRIYVTENNGGSYLGGSEFDIMEGGPPGLITSFEIASHRITRSGQEISFRIHEEIDLSDYPDGTMIMYWEEEYYGSAQESLDAAGYDDREHLKFWGWIDGEPTRIEATEEGTESYVELRCVDVGGKLARMPMFPVVIERESSSTPSYFYQMDQACIDRFVYLLVRWFSTAAQITDFIWSGTVDHWAFCVLGSEGGNLWHAINDRSRAIIQEFTCNKHGQLQMLEDPQLLDAGDRTGVIQVDIDETDWMAIDYTSQRPPRYHWNWGSAVETDRTDADAAPSLDTFFCVVPGETPGQGQQSTEHGEQLVGNAWDKANQDDLNAREGHRYAARLNAPHSTFRVRLVHSNDTGIDPAEMVWVRLTISSDNAAPRGLSFTDEKFLPVEGNIRYDHDAMTKDVEWVLERYVIGYPAETYTP